MLKLECIEVTCNNVFSIMEDEDVYVIKQSTWSHEKMIMEPVRDARVQDLLSNDTLVVRVFKKL